jgi:hypothetical protein
MVGVLFWVSAFFAEVIGTMAGFGSSTIFLPVALFFLDFRVALIIVAIFHIFGNIGRITFFRHGLSRKMLINFGVPSVVFTIIGAFSVNYVPQNILQLILGVFLIIFSLASLLRPDLSFSTSKKNSFIGGGLSGFFAGLIGTGGALRGAFLTSFNLEKSVYVSTAAAISLAVDLTRIPIYLQSGFLSQEYYYMVPLLFLLAVSGSYTGKRVINMVPQKIFRKFVLVTIVIVSLKFIFDGLKYIFST